MKILLIALVCISAIACTTVIDHKEMVWCSEACNEIEFLEIGKQSITGKICCRCSDGKVINR